MFARAAHLWLAGGSSTASPAPGHSLHLNILNTGQIPSQKTTRTKRKSGTQSRAPLSHTHSAFRVHPLTPLEKSSSGLSCSQTAQPFSTLGAPRLLAPCACSLWSSGLCIVLPGPPSGDRMRPSNPQNAAVPGPALNVATFQPLKIQPAACASADLGLPGKAQASLKDESQGAEWAAHVAVLTMLLLADTWH